MRRMDDQLGEQGVEGWAGGVAGVTKAIRPQARAAGQLKHPQGAAGGLDAAIGGEGLHVDAGLDGEPPGRGNLTLRQAKVCEGPALGNFQLRPHQVHSGDLLRDRVLHLQAGVGLDESEAAAGQQKLHGAGAAITHCLA